MPQIRGEQRQARLDIGVRAVPLDQARHGKPMAQRMWVERPAGAVVEFRVHAGLSKRLPNPTRGPSGATEAQEEGR